MCRPRNRALGKPAERRHHSAQDQNNIGHTKIRVAGSHAERQRRSPNPELRDCLEQWCDLKTGAFPRCTPSPDNDGYAQQHRHGNGNALSWREISRSQAADQQLPDEEFTRGARQNELHTLPGEQSRQCSNE
jgi:hypothetical protein